MSDYLVTFRLRPGHDGDLVAWLEGFRSIAPGAMTGEHQDTGQTEEEQQWHLTSTLPTTSRTL